MIFVPGDDSLRKQNVPSGTCVDDQSGLFSALSLDDKKMNGMQSELELNKLQAANKNNSAEKLFEIQAGPNAFALVAQGYVVLSYIS